jgi:hypothetical protein
VIDRDTVIRLAREAVNSGDGSELSGDAIERFAQLVFLEAAAGGEVSRPAVMAAAEAEGLRFVSRSHGLTTTDTVSLDVLTNIVRACGVSPSPAPEVTDAMVDAYLKANDAYWKRTDELPTPPNKWRTGTPREATRESLRAALGVKGLDDAQG